MNSSAPWVARVLTLFPPMFPGPLEHSLAGQGLTKGVWCLETVDFRSFARDKHRSVDEAPFGGGPGMIMRPEVVDAALRWAVLAPPVLPLIYLSPRGRPLDQRRVRDLAAGPGVTLLCGRYEGIDERVIEAWSPEEVSVGDYVLSGGEIAAFALLDACVRLLPGILGEPGSLSEESFERGLLEYPHYTRPRNWQGREVPNVLVSGHHSQVREWRQREAERVTRERRPDLWRRYSGDIAGRPMPKEPMPVGPAPGGSRPGGAVVLEATGEDDDWMDCTSATREGVP